MSALGPDTYWVTEATRRSQQIEQTGKDICPCCQAKWKLPLTAEGGPLVPGRLEACPLCGWRDPAAAMRDQRYEIRHRRVDEDPRTVREALLLAFAKHDPLPAPLSFWASTKEAAAQLLARLRDWIRR